LFSFASCYLPPIYSGADKSHNRAFGDTSMKIVMAVSMSHFTRKLSQPLEISSWWPFFKVAATLVEQLVEQSDVIVLFCW